jgi:hypothetical protein
VNPLRYSERMFAWTGQPANRVAAMIQSSHKGTATMGKPWARPTDRIALRSP